MKEQRENILSGLKKRQREYRRVVFFMLLVLLALVALTMIVGNTIYSPTIIWRVLCGESIQGATFTIKTLRLPRMLAGLLCGCAFGMAGNTFQKLLGNPLASPDIIGVTSGTSVAAVFGILFLHLNRSMVSWMAMGCGLLVAALIYGISGGRGFSNSRLILTGIGVQAFLNAMISWMLLKASQYDVGSALRWLSGSLNGVALEDIPALAAVIIMGSVVMAGLFRHLGILQLGDSHAVTLGIHLTATRLSLIVCSLLLVAFATSVSGPIASVAFLSGPIAGRLTKHGQTNLTVSALTGAILVLAADFVGQYAFAVRYPVGVITGILGAPYLLFLLLNMNHKGEKV